MRILVTGGAGFIGSALIKHIINNKNAHVLNYDKLTYAGNLESLKDVANSGKYEFVRADICDFEKLFKTIKDYEPNWIMHLAAESHVDRSITGADDFINTNIIGTYQILKVANKYYYGLDEIEKRNFRILHVSTDEVFGTLGEEGKFSETTSYDPSSPYSASKASSDHLMRAWYKTYGLPVIITNCSNNYGHHHFPEKFIPLAIINAIEGKSIPIYGNGNQIRDWLYVDDHVSALYEICEKGTIGETYNIGGNNERTNLFVAKEICRIFDEIFPTKAPHEKLIKFVEDRPGHDVRYAIDASKLNSQIGFHAKTKFEVGLRITIEWYLNNKEWWQIIRDKIYNGERLGLK